MKYRLSSKCPSHCAEKEAELSFVKIREVITKIAFIVEFTLKLGFTPPPGK